jgi:hypothetical protein
MEADKEMKFEMDRGIHIVDKFTKGMPVVYLQGVLWTKS